MRRSPAVGILLAVVVGALAGCAAPGGAPAPSGGASSEEPRLSQEEFVRRATEICEDGATAVERVSRRGQRKIKRAQAPAAQQEAAADLVGKLARTLRRSQRKLAALRPPEAEERQWKRYVRRAREVVTLIERTERAIRRGDRAETLALGRRTKRAGARTDRYERRFGITGCGDADTGT